MSSTSRGGKRLADDYYATPAWAVELALDWVRPPAGTRILDPCAGAGAILRVAGSRGFATAGIEIDAERAAACREHSPCEYADALDPHLAWPEHDMVVTNVPFSLAMPFLWRIVASPRPAVVLLRIAMIAGQERAYFWDANPADLGVLPRRASFTEHLRWRKGDPGQACRKPVLHTKKGKCRRPAGHDGDCLTCGVDSADYSWFAWGPGRGGKWGRLEP